MRFIYSELLMWDQEGHMTMVGNIIPPALLFLSFRFGFDAETTERVSSLILADFPLVVRHSHVHSFTQWFRKGDQSVSAVAFPSCSANFSDDIFFDSAAHILSVTIPFELCSSAKVRSTTSLALYQKECVVSPPDSKGVGGM